MEKYVICPSCDREFLWNPKRDHPEFCPTCDKVERLIAEQEREA